MIIVNFKNYAKGGRVLEIAREMDRIGEEVGVVVPAAHISEISDKTNLDVYAQNIDLVEEGSGGEDRATGLVLVGDIKASGCCGVLLNHSEHRENYKRLSRKVEVCKKAGLRTVVCVESFAEAKKVKKLNPWAIAYEDPQLIASGQSIMMYRSKAITNFGKLFVGSKILPICGAGIKFHDDLKQAKASGCKGVLVSSAIMKSKNPSQVLISMLFEEN